MYRWDGVVERTKASDATRTDAGSIPAAGGIFLRASHGVEREMPPSPDRAWQKPTGAQLETLPNLKTCFNQQFQLPPPSWPSHNKITKQLMAIVAMLKFNEKKKNNK